MHNRFFQVQVKENLQRLGGQAMTLLFNWVGREMGYRVADVTLEPTSLFPIWVSDRWYAENFYILSKYDLSTFFFADEIKNTNRLTSFSYLSFGMYKNLNFESVKRFKITVNFGLIFVNCTDRDVFRKCYIILQCPYLKWIIHYLSRCSLT